MTKPNTILITEPYECLTEANYNLRFQNQITDFRKRTHFRNWELSMLINKTCVETNHSLIDFNSKLKLSKRYQIKKSVKYASRIVVF
jgi:hypothetical protein